MKLSKVLEKIEGFIYEFEITIKISVEKNRN